MLLTYYCCFALLSPDDYTPHMVIDGDVRSFAQNDSLVQLQRITW